MTERNIDWAGRAGVTILYDSREAGIWGLGLSSLIHVHVFVLFISV